GILLLRNIEVRSGYISYKQYKVLEHNVLYSSILACILCMDTRRHMDLLDIHSLGQLLLVHRNRLHFVPFHIEELGQAIEKWQTYIVFSCLLLLVEQEFAPFSIMRAISSL